MIRPEGWYQVESSGGLAGYISSEFVQTGEAAKKQRRWSWSKKMALITADTLNIRSEPSDGRLQVARYRR